MMSSRKLIITGLSEAVTLSPLVAAKRFHDITDEDLGRIKSAWIAIQDGRIQEVGSGAIPDQYRTWSQFDGSGCIAVPGLIDAHTHPVFAGLRANEFCMRLRGATYQEIASAGGGIQSTVANTKGSSDADLEELVMSRLNQFASHGVTTVEVKSGYGLSVKEELRHLRILKRVEERSPLTLSITCLALHAVPKEFPSALAWSKTCAEELLPIIAEEKLATAVDAFIEAGYFSVADCEPYLKKARELGLAIRLHADEFSDAEAAACAADFQALSADHLQFASSDGITKMARAGVAALLLPGTSLYTGIPYTDARPFTHAGCPVGLATDFNPGSCPVDNLRLVLTMGALHCKLTMAQAIAAVTWVPAYALRMSEHKGAITSGYDADLCILPLESSEAFVADLGRATPRAVFARGQLLPF